MNPAASVVVPAHDEATVLGRCLDALIDGPLELDVVVVANACTDATAEVARERGVRVIETTVPGKAHALNLGDNAVTAFPRAYVDADVLLPQAALAATLRALEEPGALVAAPALHWDPGGVPALVRAYYRVWSSLPYVTDRMVGSGVYILSQQGRARFGAFPEVIGDDILVRSLFAHDERRSAVGTFTIYPPRTLRSLIAIKTRAAAGNAQHDATGGPARGTGGSSLRAIARSPRAWPGLPVYAAVYGLCRLRGRRQVRQERTMVWSRDTTSR